MKLGDRKLWKNMFIQKGLRMFGICFGTMTDVSKTMFRARTEHFFQTSKKPLESCGITSWSFSNHLLNQISHMDLILMDFRSFLFLRVWQKTVLPIRIAIKKLRKSASQTSKIFYFDSFLPQFSFYREKNENAVTFFYPVWAMVRIR